MRLMAAGGWQWHSHFPFQAMPLLFGHAFGAIFLLAVLIFGCAFTLHSFGSFSFLAMPLLYGHAFMFCCALYFGHAVHN